MSELIPKSLVIAFLLIQSSIILSTTEDEKYVIGFGSCITEKREQPIWEAIKDENERIEKKYKEATFAKVDGELQDEALAQIEAADAALEKDFA